MKWHMATIDDYYGCFDSKKEAIRNCGGFTGNNSRRIDKGFYEVKCVSEKHSRTYYIMTEEVAVKQGFGWMIASAKGGLNHET